MLIRRRRESLERRRLTRDRLGVPEGATANFADMASGSTSHVTVEEEEDEEKELMMGTHNKFYSDRILTLGPFF
ncbi:hypothetical protein C4D60_Mb08t30830 [Musa balbisiana]|uniref:Uncharacterized protein n=1 Tax=Musa balbisiana TaxID=52838 RepID=A0A4S8K7Q1_MUSBA|nr:hypothetical protein C4D60_Mb08t30830 [Musa balbisiana]